jgi:hypothetical protein
MEGLMLHRNTSAALSLTAVVIAALAAPIQTTEAEEAVTGECLSRPNKAAPDGSHWWYRIDRSTHRRCWYLGPERTGVRKSSRARRETRPADPPPTETAPPRSQPITPGAAAAAGEGRRSVAIPERSMAMPATSAADTTPAEPSTITSPQAEPADTTSAELGTPMAPAFSAGWPSVASSSATNEPTAAVDTEGETEDSAPVEPSAGMPLVWPELTDADRAAFTNGDRAAVTQSSGSTPGIGHLFLFIATLAAFVAVALHVIVKLRKTWVGYRRGRSSLRTAHQPVQPMQEPAIGARQESDVFARWKAAARDDRLHRRSRWEKDRAPAQAAAKRAVPA